MKARKRNIDERQLSLNFQRVEHTVTRASKAANEPRFSNTSSRTSRRGMFHGDVSLDELADRIQAEDRLRLLETTSLPKVLRGWSPRPRPQTAIIAYAAQRAYERRMAREAFTEAQQAAIEKFLGQRDIRLRRYANKLLRSSNP